LVPFCISIHKAGGGKRKLWQAEIQKSYRLQTKEAGECFLHMIRQFYVWGEEVKRSIDWLTKRLIKIGARVSYHARKWYVQNWGDSPAGGCMIKW
jgi:alkylhydroperoxidase/carboxymuconolactone decarboxylase family protein YurZ